MEWHVFNGCPLCGRREFVSQFDLGTVKVAQCAGCRLSFLNPYLSPESMAEVYSTTGTLQQTNPLLSHYYSSLQGTQTEKFYRHILKQLSVLKSGGSLLDVGCGRGEFLSLAREAGWRVSGLEPAREHAQYGIEKRGIDIQIATLEEADFKEESFEVITLWDVIEHVPNPRDIVVRLSGWLKKGGLLLLATPNHQSLPDFMAYAIYFLSGGIVKKPLTYFFVPEHVLYFTPSTLRNLVEQCGLQPVEEIKSGTDIDRYTASRLFKVTAKILLFFARICQAENRITLICRKSLD